MYPGTKNTRVRKTYTVFWQSLRSNPKPMKHTTGWYVWVGGKKHWFRDEDRAIDFAVLRQSQYGSAVVRRERADDREMTPKKAAAWRRSSNPSKKRKRKASPSKRVSSALSRFLKRQNPAFKRASGVRVQKLKGGVIKLTPM